MVKVGKLLEELLDYIYPESIYCICCGKIIDKTRSYSLCDQCMDAINWATGNTCQRCGKPLDDMWQNKICANCIDNHHDFDKGYTCCQYGLYARAIIFSYKYNGNNYIGKYLGQAMADRIAMEELKWDVIVPVPTEKEKERQRGFDHAFLLAKTVADKTQSLILPALDRTKKTIAQRGLDPYMRKSNLQGAIGVNPYLVDKIKDKDILLIDDIYTTGATADECSRILKEKGARKITLLTFAAGGNRHDKQSF